jgi:hypothetical protein
MAKGYRNGGWDFDDLFDPDATGDGPTVANLRTNGVALRYAALRYGTKRADVGYRQNGVDVSNLWAAKGTAVYSLPFNGRGYSAAVSALSGQTGTVGSSVSLSINSNGTWVIGGGPNFNGSPTSGTWLPAGLSAADHEVRFIISGNTGGAVNGAPNFASCSVSRGCGVRAQVRADSIEYVENSIDVQCQLRRISTGAITTTSCSLFASALGQV